MPLAKNIRPPSKNDEKDIVSNFKILKVTYIKDKA